MTYYVTYKIDARFTACVEADNVEEAKQKADDVFTDADFGDAHEVDGDKIIVENENRDCVWGFWRDGW